MGERRPFNDDFPELEMEVGDPNEGNYGCKLWLGDECVAEWRRHVPSPDGMTNTILKVGAQIAVNRFNVLLEQLQDLEKAIDAMGEQMGKKEVDSTDCTCFEPADAVDPGCPAHDPEVVKEGTDAKD